MKNEFVITTYEMKSPRLSRDVTALLVSDLHANEFGRDNCTLLKACADLRPDLILCAGDMRISKVNWSAHVAEAFLKRANEIAPVYMANGNHETAVRREPDRYQAYLRETVRGGTVLLNNRSCRAVFREQPFRITGLELKPVKYRKLVPPRLTCGEIEESVGKRREDAFQILIAHNPQFAEQYNGGRILRSAVISTAA